MATRTLHLKHARFRSGRKKDFVPPALDTLLAAVLAAAPNFKDRHFPPPSALAMGTPCVFINRMRARKAGGMFFEIYSYTWGAHTSQFRPDFTKATPDITTGPIKDAQGNTREIAYSYRCVALGQSVIVEYNPRAGGLEQLSNLLSYLFHTHVQKGLPTIEFMDVSTKELDKAIAAGGGVDRVMLRLADGGKPSENAWYATRLSELRKKLTGARQVTVTWETDDNVINAKSAMAVIHEFEAEDTTLDKLSLKLKDGQVIPSLTKFREKRVVSISTVPGGGLAITEIESALWHYLDELRTVQAGGWRVIDNEGNFVSGKAVSLKK